MNDSITAANEFAKEHPTAMPDSSFLAGAQWQKEQDSAEMENLKNTIEALKDQITDLRDIIINHP